MGVMDKVGVVEVKGVDENKGEAEERLRLTVRRSYARWSITNVDDQRTFISTTRVRGFATPSFFCRSFNKVLRLAEDLV